MAYPMGEAKPEPLRVDFDRRIKLEFHGARITSDGGLLAYGELDDAVGLIDTAVAALSDGRRGRNIRHRLAALLRQSVLGRLAGYEDVNDAERLARDPAMRAIVGREGLDRLAASSSQMGRFETEWLASDANLAHTVDFLKITNDNIFTCTLLGDPAYYAIRSNPKTIESQINASILIKPGDISCRRSKVPPD